LISTLLVKRRPDRCTAQQAPTGQWIIQASDPQGVMFCLLSPKG